MRAIKCFSKAALEANGHTSQIFTQLSVIFHLTEADYKPKANRLSTPSLIMPPTKPRTTTNRQTKKTKTKKSTASSVSSISSSTVLPSSGFLLTCDPPAKQFIKYLDDKRSIDKKFILQDLDATHLLIVNDLKVRQDILKQVEEWMDEVSIISVCYHDFLSIVYFCRMYFQTSNV